jgi:hypothetical protein
MRQHAVAQRAAACVVDYVHPGNTRPTAPQVEPPDEFVSRVVTLNVGH